MRVIECDFCGEALSAANDDELVQSMRSHMDERHSGEQYDEARLRALIEQRGYDASDS